MGKKKGAKKGGDDFFEDGVPELDEAVSSPSSERKSAFASLSLDDAPSADAPSDEEGGGGLMAQMSKAQANASAGKGKDDLLHEVGQALTKGGAYKYDEYVPLLKGLGAVVCTSVSARA